MVTYTRCDECSTRLATVCGTWCADCYADLMAPPVPADIATRLASGDWGSGYTWTECLAAASRDEGGPFRLEALAADRHGDRWGADPR